MKSRLKAKSHSCGRYTIRYSETRMLENFGYSDRHSKTIVISRDWAKMCPNKLKSTIVHEMIHAYLRLSKKFVNDHGENFRTEMKRINLLTDLRLKIEPKMTKKDIARLFDVPYFGYTCGKCGRVWEFLKVVGFNEKPFANHDCPNSIYRTLR